MYILDTDHLSLIQRNGEEGKRIIERLRDVELAAVTIITYEEQLRGRLSVLSRAKTLDKSVLAYRGLYQTSLDYQSIRVIPFDQTSALKHQRLKKDYPRIGNADLKIAAITITYKATLLTRNKSDFGQIREIQIEDWSRE